MDEKQVAYVRHTGTYETLAKEYANLMQTLFAHAKKQHFLVDGQNWLLAMYHDNPEFGEASQFRTSLCLTVPKDIRVQEDGVLGMMKESMRWTSTFPLSPYISNMLQIDSEVSIWKKSRFKEHESII